MIVDLLRFHRAALPQKDELCGAFCASLALSVAGHDFDQDDVAAAAGTLVSTQPDEQLPPGEQGRRDYRVGLPTTATPALSGTTPAGIVRAIGQLSGRELVGLPLRGPWTAAAVAGLLAAANATSARVTLLANVATRYLWGSHASGAAVVRHLVAGSLVGPQPDWDVGHFVCLTGLVEGPGGSLVIVADTYPSLGWEGLHLQPSALIAAALERPDLPDGGVIAVTDAAGARDIRGAAETLGLRQGLWDNGTVEHDQA